MIREYAQGPNTIILSVACGGYEVPVAGVRACLPPRMPRTRARASGPTLHPSLSLAALRACIPDTRRALRRAFDPLHPLQSPTAEQAHRGAARGRV
jgi:hypothetical protein